MISLTPFRTAAAVYLIALMWLTPTSTHGQWMDARIRTLDGTQLTGSISSIESDGMIRGTQLPGDLNLADIANIELNTELVNESINLVPVTVRLVNGSQIVVYNLELKDETLRFETGIGVTQLPLQTVRAIIYKHSAGLAELLDRPSKSDDRVLVAANEGERTVQGLVEVIDSIQLQIQYQNDSRKISLNRINSVVTADVGITMPRGSLATLTMADGSEVRGIIRSFKGDVVELQLLESLTLKLSAAQVKSIAIQSDRQQFLSEVDPINVRQKTEFTIQRTWQRDLNIQGNRLTLRAPGMSPHDSSSTGARQTGSFQISDYKKGLGTQAFTQLDFANDRDFTRFKTTVGIDTETKGRGDCRMVVRGDGIELWSSRVKATDLAVDIDLDITGMNVISLIVYPGEAFDLADHANWCNARFVK